MDPGGHDAPPKGPGTRPLEADVQRSGCVRPASSPLALVVATVLLGCGDATPRVRAIPPLAELPVDPPERTRPAATATVVSGAVAQPVPATRFFDHPEALKRFFAALAALDKRQRSDDVHIVQFGDSHTAADYETGPLRRALQQRFGDGGRGFVAIGRPWKPYTQEGIHRTGMTGWAPERGHYAKGKFTGDGQYGLLGVAIATSQHGARAWSDLDRRRVPRRARVPGSAPWRLFRRAGRRQDRAARQDRRGRGEVGLRGLRRARGPAPRGCGGRRRRRRSRLRRDAGQLEESASPSTRWG